MNNGISIYKMNTFCDLFQWACEEAQKGNMAKAMKLKRIADKFGLIEE